MRDFPLAAAVRTAAAILSLVVASAPLHAQSTPAQTTPAPNSQPAPNSREAREAEQRAAWQAAAAGKEEGGKLLMKGQIKFAKGPMSAAIENAGALNNFLLTWGQVPTDWDV